MRRFISLIPLLAFAACSDKGTTDDTAITPSGDDTSTDDTGDVEAEPVWEDIRVETSSTLTDLFVADNNIYVCAEGGNTWARLSGSWTVLTIDTDDEDLNGLWGTGTSDAIDLVTVGDAGNIGTWEGGEWVVEDIGTANLEAVDGGSASDLLAVGWGGVYSNVSGTWEYQDVSTSQRYNDVWWDGSTAVAVGEDGAYAINEGGGWLTDDLASRTTLNGVHGTGPTDVWAVGPEGTVIHWDGTEWTSIPIETRSSLWAVRAVSDQKVYVVGSNGAAYVYDGTEWTELPTGVDNNLYALYTTSGGDVYAVGNRGMVLRYTGD